MKHDIPYYIVGPNLALLALLVACAVYDIRSRRIPNNIIAFGFIFIGGYSFFSETISYSSLAFGTLVGLLCFLPLYLLRWMGAGDVKLMAMVGAFLGPQGALFSGLYTALAGGFLALWYQAKKPGTSLPYGVAILLGCTAYIFLQFH